MDSVASNEQSAIFWYGCNMARHGELIRASAKLLEMVGWKVSPKGGMGYCCGSPKESSARISGAMGRRTVEKFNSSGQPHLITWCPSCHMNMEEVIEPVNELAFDTRHISQILYENREKLGEYLRKPVNLTLMMHAHQGFDNRVPVNTIVPELLSLVPGVKVVPFDYKAPGYMCHSLVRLPGSVFADMQMRTLDSMKRNGASALCTVFHACHRNLVGLEQRNAIKVVNWVHVLAESAGIEAPDMYKTLRNADAPSEHVPPDVMDRVGDLYSFVEPELKKRSSV